MDPIIPPATMATDGKNSSYAPADETGPVGARVVRGFAWSMSQTVLSKAIATVGQIVLARLLMPQDFGLVSLALTVAAFAGLVRDGGLSQVLVQRQAEFGRWVNPAFWMSMGMGLLSALLMAVAAPFAGRLYGAPVVVNLILILAVASPIQAMATVSGARLQAAMRFRELSALGLGTSLLTVGLNVGFALAGFGPYSFVIPQVIVAVLRLAAVCWLAPPTVLRNWEVAKWPSLMRDTGLLLATSFTFLLTGQGDYIILGWLQPEKVVGLYSMAFSLSMQAIQLLTTNLSAVLFPALSRLQEPERQLRAFLDASRVIAFISVPACLLQAALAEPLVRLLLGEKWLAVGPLLRILSYGMCVASIGFLGGSLVQARAQYYTFFKLSVFSASLFGVMVGLGAWNGAAYGTACAVALHLAIMTIIGLRVATRPVGGTWGDIVRLCAPPLLFSSLAVGGAYGLWRAMPVASAGDGIQLVVVGAAAVFLYVPILYVGSPATVGELKSRLGALRLATV
jgi:O-antigen/teichoic acid export membrane protein